MGTEEHSRKLWRIISPILIIVVVVLNIMNKLNAEEEVQRLRRENSEYSMNESKYSSFNSNLKEHLGDLLRNKETLKFQGRNDTSTSEEYTNLFFSIASIQEQTLEDFFEDFSGIITYQRMMPMVVSGTNERDYYYFYEDKFSDDFYFERKNNSRVYTPGSNNIRVDYRLDEETKEIIKINKVVFRSYFDIMYSPLELGGDYEILSKLPAKEVEIKVKNVIGSPDLNNNINNEIEEFKPKEFVYIIKITAVN